MLFIYGTDAPLYHYPIVTVAMIVINVLVHWLIVITGFDASPYYLYFGDGFHPIQWVTHNFLHIGWLHLIFNMIFLWPFGMIVEGKIGWARMLVLYLGIGACQGFTQQLIMLPSDPKNQAAEFVQLLDNPDDPMTKEERRELYNQFRQDLLRSGACSLGASAVIFGLLAICALWAPDNEFEVYFRWSLLIRAPDGGLREWTVLTVCLMFVVKEIGMFFLQNGALSSEALHLNGFVVGGAIGLGMLYFGLVDCEGYDMISKVTGEKFKAQRTTQRELKEHREAVEAAKPQGPPQAVVPQMAHRVAADRPRTRPAAPKPAPPPSATGVQPVAPLPPVPSPTPTVPLQPTEAPEDGFGFAEALPAFDDAVPALDPAVEARNQIETAVAHGDFVGAVRSLADSRRQDRDFVLSAASMGKLAEGLLGQKHTKPALTVLGIAAESYPAYAPRWRIRAATVELAVNHDPIAAIKLLKLVDKEMLDQATRQQFLKVASQAQRMAKS